MKHEFDIFFDKNDEGDDGYDKKASEMIVNSNKAVIKTMMNELAKFKKVPQQPHKVLQTPTATLPIPPRFGITPESSKNIDSRGNGKKPKLEEIYRADDLQNHRMTELESRLKEKQEEMDSMLHNKKPTSIDFSDTKLNDNKLASDEMDKLIAQALSSRQRELEQLSTNINKDDSKHAEEWISGSSDPVTSALNASIAVKRSHEIKRPTNQNSIINKKNVSFNDGNNEEILYDKEGLTGVETFARDDTLRDTIHDNQQLSFLSKIKRTNTMNRGISNVDTIPLDDFMTEYEEDGASGDDTIQLFIDEKPRDVRDSREYDKLDEKINKMQTYLETVKQTQDKILELLEKVERHK